MNQSGYLSGPFPGDLVSGGYTVLFDPSNKNTWTVTTGEGGYITVNYDLVVSGPLDSLGAAPHLNGTINFRVNDDGSIDYSFDRDGFPWAEAYYYDGKGGVETIFRDPAIRGNPYDLFAIEPNPGPLAKLYRDRQRDAYGNPLDSSQDNLCQSGGPC